MIQKQVFSKWEMAELCWAYRRIGGETMMAAFKMNEQVNDF